MRLEYATFGKIQGKPSGTGSGGAGGATSPDSSAQANFVPTRRVREAPGGKSSIAFYDDAREDALAAAPPAGDVSDIRIFVIRYSYPSYADPSPNPLIA